MARIGMGTAAILAFALAGCAMQATGRAPRSTGMGRGPSPVDTSALGTREVEGRLLRVDGANGILVIGEGSDAIRLEAIGETDIFVEGGVGALDDLREGAPVRATYFMRDGRSIAAWIEIPRREGEDRAGLEKAEKEVAR